MSFFTDFLIATKREAKKVAATDNPTQRWPGVSCKNLMCLEVAILYGLMTGVTDVDGVVELEDKFEFLVGGVESVELRLFPTAFTSALAAIGPAEIARLAQEWRALDESAVSEWEPDEVRGLLDKLRVLAGRAVASGRPVMMYISGF